MTLQEPWARAPSAACDFGSRSPLAYRSSLIAFTIERASNGPTRSNSSSATGSPFQVDGTATLVMRRRCRRRAGSGCERLQREDDDAGADQRGADEDGARGALAQHRPGVGDGERGREARERRHERERREARADGDAGEAGGLEEARRPAPASQAAPRGGAQPDPEQQRQRQPERRCRRRRRRRPRRCSPNAGTRRAIAGSARRTRPPRRSTASSQRGAAPSAAARAVRLRVARHHQRARDHDGAARQLHGARGARRTPRSTAPPRSPPTTT